MNKDFWIQKWQTGETRFHQSKFHRALEKYAMRFQTGTILVPLCGKSLDMLFLASHGLKVIGVELSPIACRDFFIENGLSASESTVGSFTVFEADNIQLWCGDFFDLPQSVWIQVTGVYDRAALVALPVEIRQRYAAEILKRSGEELNILLVSFEYPQEAMEGPPFSVPEKEITTIYPGCRVQLLETVKEERYKDHPTLSRVELFETVFWIHK